MSDEEKNDLFYVCSLIEHVGRGMQNRCGDMVAATDNAYLNYKARRSLK